MIEKVDVDGRPAIVAYFDDEFNPAHKADATMIKVRFVDDEGGVMFGVKTRPTAEAVN